MFKLFRNIFWSANFFIFISCNAGTCSSNAPEKSGNEKSISIVSWNTQTFFDAKTEGNEYSDFLNSAKWNEEKYKQRLNRLCETILNLNADVYVLQEIENEAVLYDIYNFLAGNSWDSKKELQYGVFYKDNNSSIGIGLLSRFPVEDIKVHSLNINIYNSKQPSMRPILEANILMDDEKITIYGNHWKSMSNGMEESEIWRQWQECHLAETLTPKAPFVACGDFNKDISEFAKYDSLTSSNTIVFRGIKKSDAEKIGVKSLWLNDNGTFTTTSGSYFYKNNWNRIDHFFTSEKLRVNDFKLCDGEPWATEEGIPFSYKIYTGNGYSDHFPISCNLTVID